jgi:hypothetical protein
MGKSGVAEYVESGALSNFEIVTEGVLNATNLNTNDNPGMEWI